MEETVGFISLGILMVGNMILLAYTFGKLSQKVEDLCHRVERLENHVFNGKK